jgi:AraC-like DNA-binding protein
MLSATLISTIEDTLSVEYVDGAETTMGYPYSTGWRTLPFSVTAQTVAGEVDVVLANGQTLKIGDGEAFYVAGGVHHLADKTTIPPCLSRWSHVNLSVFGSVDLNRVLAVPARFTGPAARLIGAINEELAVLHRSRSPSMSSRIQERALGLSLASILLEAAEPRLAAGNPLAELQRLVPVLTYIEAHLADTALPRERLAVIACLSSSRFFAVFKRVLGVGPGDYVRNVRLQWAQRLLIGSDHTVQEIAVKVGYPDPFHFRRLFKRHFGASPTHYRHAVRDNLRW